MSTIKIKNKKLDHDLCTFPLHIVIKFEQCDKKKSRQMLIVFAIKMYAYHF